MSKRSQLPKSTSGRGSKAPVKQTGTPRWLILAVVGAVVLVVAGVILLQAQSLRPSVPAQAQVSEGLTWGPTNAPVTVVEFSNFGCIHCRTFALNTGKQIRALYEPTGKVRFEFKPFRLGDPAPDNAAAAAFCAADQGRFWDYHDVLFSRQGVVADPFTRSALKQYAAQLGLDTAAFNSCVDGGKRIEDVYRSSSEGTRLGVNGTPTFFINGKRVEVPYTELQTAIEAALQAAGG